MTNKSIRNHQLDLHLAHVDDNNNCQPFKQRSGERNTSVDRTAFTTVLPFLSTINNGNPILYHYQQVSLQVNSKPNEIRRGRHTPKQCQPGEERNSPESDISRDRGALGQHQDLHHDKIFSKQVISHSGTIDTALLKSNRAYKLSITRNNRATSFQMQFKPFPLSLINNWLPQFRHLLVKHSTYPTMPYGDTPAGNSLLMKLCHIFTTWSSNSSTVTRSKINQRWVFVVFLERFSNSLELCSLNSSSTKDGIRKDYRSCVSTKKKYSLH